MIKGMVKHELLKTSDGVLRLAEDTLCGGFSLGIRTPEGADWRYISDELGQLLIKELSNNHKDDGDNENQDAGC
ncbi:MULTISPECIES: hypothetical protein [Bacillus subtilis group]|uniref:hypothetical protein n=1 Tax=Bacillus subtilis group TaxID=653685 RepID=UPI000E723144|nr:MULTISPECIES: hypothetical protein [Bacillus subtilis group]MEC0396543.1 hypothetical protein [Bacillus subtilis]MEC1490022.1 hypothetical protein [Bacillus subtilis]QHQ79397.1 hypothetical protein GPJ55_06280 [Bacillus subtilis]RJS53024.1 hypothetical protein CJ480_14980 [Bacillus subtilis]RPK20954.1 hypothetical protein EH2_00247 [Bacillus subtilis]